MMLQKFSAFLAALALSAQVSASSEVDAESTLAPKQPNLIVILTDDQGYQDVGFNGSTEIATPHIDRIANEGARFTNGYVTFSVCGPSRAGLLTGRHQERFGFNFNPSVDPSVPGNGIPLSEKNIAEVLQPSGYTSGIVGKWHMGTHPDMRPNKRGFDYFYGFLSGGHRYFPEEMVFNDLSEVEHKYDWYQTRLLRNEERIDFDEYLTDELSHEAVDFIKREKDNPFFLYVSYNAPHAPLQASQEYLQRYSHIENERRRTYAAMIAAVDDGVGRILDTLKEQGIDDNTLVFFLSDNGGPERHNASDNGPLRDGKNSLFEGGVRVPFAARWPGVIPAGFDYENPVSSMDILATIASQANVDTSENKPLDGVDLIPFLTGEDDGLPHDVLFWRHLKAGGVAVRMGDEKFVRKGDERMLFDVSSDLSETKDLSASKQERTEYFDEQIDAWSESFPAPAFPDAHGWKKPAKNKKRKNNNQRKKNNKVGESK
ncbi:sulfatase [Microbulbifer agarilyticus]|uniref:sulfatase n=1 Tax=Microbulbifer agarilyticus TaxID=260552 RepID=UPI001C93E623|nr:sulfatase [Microbulbifer agarilyticus]MBY6210942.1 sulfatase [Microbulbifer agarilyticus]